MRSIILKNIGPKVSAVLIAVFLWFFVTSQGQSEISLDAPVEFKNIPSALGIVSSSVKSVTLTIRGQERFMKGINASDLRVFIDLSKARQGEVTYHVNKEDVKLPFTMNVMGISPSSVRVKLEEISQKTVPIRPVITGSPEKGYVTAVEAEPRMVVIKGLKSELRKIEMIRTEPMDVSQAKGTFTEELELDMSGLNIKVDSANIKVKATIAEKRR